MQELPDLSSIQDFQEVEEESDDEEIKVEEEEEEEVEVESVNQEIIALQAQLQAANETIANQEKTIADQTTEIESLKQHIQSVNMEELVQLFQLQKIKQDHYESEINNIQNIITQASFAYLIVDSVEETL